MFSCSIFKFIVCYFPVFDFFNFIFEIKILEMLFTGNKVFMVFSQILEFDNLRRQFFLKWIRLSFVIYFSFICEFIILKNVNIIFLTFSVWQSYQFFIYLVDHFFFRHQLIIFWNVALWIPLLLLFNFIHLFLS